MVHDRNCKVRMVGRFLLRNILAVGDTLWAYFQRGERGCDLKEGEVAKVPLDISFKFLCIFALVFGNNTPSPFAYY